MAAPTDSAHPQKDEHQAEVKAPGISPPGPRVSSSGQLPSGQWDRKSLEKKSKEELIDIVAGLNTASLRTTRRVDVQAPPPTSRRGAAVERFIRVPVAPSQKALAHTSAIWRVILISSNPSHEPLGLEIAGNVIVGRAAEDTNPDLDLTHYGAVEKGVSRRHAMMRPTSSALLVMDLRSTNGTYLNSTRFEAGTAQSVKDGDTVSFGQLHFKVHLAD